MNGTTMKRMLTATLIAALVSINFVGCSEADKSSTKQETKISTPGGSTTITTEKTVEKSGDAVPAKTP